LTAPPSRRGADFDRGEFVLTKRRPRIQSRTEIALFGQGDAVIFPVHHRPPAAVLAFAST
jgi:hypothetical protein